MSITREVDIRLYTANGTRKSLPSYWVESIEFDISEQGGNQNGMLSLMVPWEQLALAGNEYVDVRLWGCSTVIYRGFVRVPESDLGYPERNRLNLFGLMELLNGYLVRRDVVYADYTSTDTIFTDLLNQYATPNIANLQINATTSALAINFQFLSVSGKTLSQALNTLCEAATGSIIWMCDVDGSGRNRVNLLARASTVKYKYSVGSTVEAFVYPVDTNQVVNSLLITGGAAVPTIIDPTYNPNLLPNASFEDAQVPSFANANILSNPSFDGDNGGTRPGFGWLSIGDPSLDSGYARNGIAAVLDDNPTAPEGIYQDFPVAAAVHVAGSLWYMAILGESWTFTFALQYLDGAGTVIGQESTSITQVGDNVYRQAVLDYASGLPSGAIKVRFLVETTAGSGSHGLNIDDCAMYFPDQITATDWEVAQVSLGAFSALDWASPGTGGVLPFDGVVMVVAEPDLTGAAGASFPTGISETLFLTIPSGPYSSGAWTRVYVDNSVETSADTIGTHHPPTTEDIASFALGTNTGGNVTETIAVTADQLADINSYAGASFPLPSYYRYNGPDPAQNMISLVLTLTLTAGGTVTVDAVIPTGYADLEINFPNKISVSPNLTYIFSVYLHTAGVTDIQFQIGTRQFSGTQEGQRDIGVPITLSHAGVGWQNYQYLFRTNTTNLNNGGTGATDGLMPFIRFLTDSVPVYLDACGLYVGSAIPPIYYPSDIVTAARDVTDYSGSLSSAAAASITNYGLRQKALTQELIVDEATLDAFCIGYFNAYAVPQVQARLSLFGARAPLGFDGQVLLLNLPSAPPALTPSLVRYKVGEAITIEADLGNERPSLALLLRQSQQDTLL